MPNRYLRQSFIESDSVNALGFAAECVFIRLLVTVDDWGRCEANIRLLRAKLFPLQLAKVRETDLSRWLAICERAGLIAFYEVDGKQFIQMMKWERGRAETSKCPSPPSKILDTCFLKTTSDRSRGRAPTAANSRGQPPTAANSRGQPPPTPTPTPTPSVCSPPSSDLDHVEQKNGFLPQNTHAFEKKPPENAEIPSLSEVLEAAKISGITPESAQNFFDHHEANSLWINQHNRLINWRYKLRSWAVKDRKTKENRMKTPSGMLKPGF